MVLSGNRYSIHNISPSYFSSILLVFPISGPSQSQSVRFRTGAVVFSAALAKIQTFWLKRRTLSEIKLFLHLVLSFGTILNKHFVQPLPILAAAPKETRKEAQEI